MSGDLVKQLARIEHRFLNEAEGEHIGETIRSARCRIADDAATITDLRAENARLRPFVQHYAEQPCSCGVIPGLTVECAPCAARAALEPKP